MGSAPRDWLRIGMVCPYSLTIYGGVQGQVMGLARVLRARGHEVRVLGPCDGAPPATFVTPLGNSLPTAANGSIAPLAPDPSASLRTIRALRDEDFDVLHLHEPLAPGCTLTSLVVRPAPILATFHAAGGPGVYRVLTAPLRALLERIDHRVVVSKDALVTVQEHLGGEYEVLFNGVEVDRFTTPAAGGAVRGSTSTSERTIFFCGRHEPRKGLDVLLAAMGRLPDDVRCWVASEGPDTPALRERFGSDDRIEWLGRISDEEKISRLQRASVFCAPSLHGESFGVVLIEAMAAGAPVVASALDGYRNVATDGVDSLLVEPGDVDALAGAVRRVLDDRDLADRLRRQGSARAEEFSMVRLAEAYEGLYRDLLAKRDLHEPPGDPAWSGGAQARQRRWSWRRRRLRLA